MALFTDISLVCVDDLVKVESGIVQLVTAEGIDAATKIELGRQLVGFGLLELLREERPGELLVREQPALARVVATAGVKLCIVYRALEQCYRDAYANQLNDRYQQKWQEYERLYQQTFIGVTGWGVPMVWSPLARARKPILTAVEGNVPAGLYYVAVALAGPTGAEGAISEAAAYDLSGGGSLQAVLSDNWAGSWNVYAGTEVNQLRQQNSEPLASTDVWRMPESGLVGGAFASDGQIGDFVVRRRRLLGRG